MATAVDTERTVEGLKRAIIMLKTEMGFLKVRTFNLEVLAGTREAPDVTDDQPTLPLADDQSPSDDGKPEIIVASSGNAYASESIAYHAIKSRRLSEDEYEPIEIEGGYGITKKKQEETTDGNGEKETGGSGPIIK